MVLMFNGQEVPAAQGPGKVYSTEERRIGTWTDGKPLYERTFIGTGPSNTSDWMKISQDNFVENVDWVVRLEGCVNPGAPYGFIPIPQQGGTAVYMAMVYNPGTDSTRPTGIIVHSSLAQMVNKPLIAVMQYTKTTDVPGMIPPDNFNSGLHLYSREEKIVGVWEDGRYVYERTINLNWSSDNTSITVLDANQITEMDIDIILNLNGTIRGNWTNGQKCCYTIPRNWTPSTTSHQVDLGIGSDGRLALNLSANAVWLRGATVTIRYIKNEEKSVRSAQEEEA